MRGYDPPHFDPHLTLNFKTNNTLSFVYSKLVRHKVGAGVAPGTFTIEPDLAERWEEPDDTTVVFHLRKGVRWQNKPPVNGRELTAEDVKFTFDRFLTEKANPLRFMLDPVDRVEVVDRYTVRFRLKEPFVWLLNMLANPTGTWIVAREVVDKYGDLKKPETAIGTGPFILERYEPNVKTVFKRNPDYFRTGPARRSTAWTGWSWRTRPPQLAAYRTGQLDCRPLALVDRPPAGRGRAQEEPSPARLPGLPVQRDDRDLHADRQAPVQRRARAPRDLPRRRPAGHHRRRLPQGRADARHRPRPPRVVAAHRPARPGAQYYRHDPKEARRLLAEAGFPGA